MVKPLKTNGAKAADEPVPFEAGRAPAPAPDSGFGVDAAATRTETLTHAEVRLALAEIYRQMQPPIFLFTAFLLVASAGLLFLYEVPPPLHILRLCLMASGILLGGLALGLRVWPAGPRWVHPIGFAAAMVILLNISVPAASLEPHSQAVFLILFVLGCGCVSLSLTWLGAVILVTGGAWFFYLCGGAFVANPANVALVFAFLMAPTICSIRLRSYTELIRLQHEQRAREASLRDSEERFRALTDTMPAIIIIHRQGVIDYVNRAAVDITGYARSELVGQNIQRLVHPDAHERLRQQAETRSGGDRSPWRYELKALHRSGTARWLDVASNVITHRGEDSILVCAFDITARKAAEEALAASEDRFRAIVNNANDVIFTLAADGVCTFISPAIERLAGHRPQAIIGQTLDAWIHPDDLGAFQAALRGVTEGRRERSTAEYRIRAARDSWAWHHTTLAVVRESSGSGMVIIGVSKDTTERVIADESRRQSEARVLHAQKLESLGVLAGGIAHDFNNLLVAILGNVSLLLADADPSARDRPALQDIETAALRAADLCRQMLAYSGRGKFVVASVDLSRLVEEIGQLLRVSISKRVRLEYRLARDLPAIEGDVSQLHQVVMNLITNASEAIGDAEGTIRVATGVTDCVGGPAADGASWGGDHLPAGRYVYLEVADTGCGMDEATRARIFDPFFTTKFTGRGLGMAAVQGIVRGHKGTIECSTAPGQGSTFRIRFPASVGPAAAPTLAAPDPNWRHRGLLLVIDDEPAVRQVAAKTLEGIGFRVLVAADGVEGLEIFRRYPDKIVAVLSDLTMPRMGGEETCRQLHDLRPDLPVILSSGFDERESAQRVADFGFAAFLQKPYRGVELIECVRSVLELTPAASAANGAPRPASVTGSGGG